VNDSTWTCISVSGTSYFYSRGVYGEKDIPNSKNYPGSRSNALSLYDSRTKTVILFGGNGYDSVTLGKYFTKSTHC